MGERNLNQFMRMRNQLTIAAENLAKDQSMSPVLIPKMSKHMDEQLKLAYKVIDVVDRANKKVCVTLLQYNMDKPESSYAQVRIIARKKEDEKYQQLL